MVGIFDIAYINGILVYSPSLDIHVTHVRQVLSCLLENQLYVKGEKCKFHVPEILFLGYFINQEGMDIEKAKVASLMSWPILKRILCLDSLIHVFCPLPLIPCFLIAWLCACFLTTILDHVLDLFPLCLLNSLNFNFIHLQCLPDSHMLCFEIIIDWKCSYITPREALLKNGVGGEKSMCVTVQHSLFLCLDLYKMFSDMISEKL